MTKKCDSEFTEDNKELRALINNRIIEIVNSDDFRPELNKINKHYFNLKQEFHIRNLILELLNDSFEKETNCRAFAEHPRKGRKRVDLSIVNKKENQQVLIEFKFQFSGDYSKFNNYKKIVESDFEERCSDIFILIVADWNKNDSGKHEDEWGIKRRLSGYLEKGTKELWKPNLDGIFKEYPNAKLEKCQLTIKEPYQTKYHFYFLQRK